MIQKTLMIWATFISLVSILTSHRFETTRNSSIVINDACRNAVDLTN